jgi:N-acetylglucosamine-6-phosphate deacetylase
LLPLIKAKTEHKKSYFARFNFISDAMALKPKIIKNSKFYRNDKLIDDEDILINDEKIIRTAKNIIADYAEVIDAQKNLITPGFIDLQVNGGYDIFFNDNINVNAVNSIYNAHNSKGTRFILITLITDELNIIQKAIKVVKEAMRDNSGILGLHLEGPFLSKEKPGAHNPEIIRKPSDEELEIILQEGEGIIKKITVAPEVFTNQQLQKLIDSGIIVSIGHSNATFDQALQYFEQGVKCVTHLYNAMSPFQSRAPGVIGAAFTSDVFAGIIVDGLHSHFKAVEIACKLKKGKIFLVSDASFTGIKNQDHLNLQGIEVSIKDGKIYTKKGSLAGASITISDAIKNCLQYLEITKSDIIKMATETPAKVLGLEKSIGFIEPGRSSKLNVLDDNFNLIQLIN